MAMARPTKVGLINALCVLVALAAAATTLGISADWAASVPSGASWPWWLIMLVACSSVLTALALLALLFQCVRCGGPASLLGVLLSCLGVGVSIGMVAAWTVALVNGDVYAAWLAGRALGSGARYGYGRRLLITIGSLSWNTSQSAFNYWGSWSTKAQVLFIFGCCIGAAFWLLAVVTAVIDVGAAKRRQHAEAEANAAVLNVGGPYSAYAAPAGAAAPAGKQDPQFMTAV